MNTNVPGLTFKSESLDPKSIAILGTTNIIHGAFYLSDTNASDHSENERPGRATSINTIRTGDPGSVNKPVIHAMLATWPANGSKTLGSRMHTPDTCWLGSGWKETQELPFRTIEVGLGTNTVVLQTRVFKRQEAGARVCVSWAFLINGRPQNEQWTQEGERTYGSIGYLIVRGKMFLQNTLIAFAHRNLKENTVQYMRLHCTIDGDPSAAVDGIRRYAKFLVSGRAS
jgi:hypothetical protein